jgi:hypothetical protein
MGEDNLRRTFWILLTLLISTSARGQSAEPFVPIAAGADACRYALIYKGASLVGSQAVLGIRMNLGLCQDWAEKHGDWEAAHDSYVALESLYDLQSAALKDQLYPKDNAPSVCRVFLDYQIASRTAIMDGVSAHLPESEVGEKVARAKEDFRASFKRSTEESDKAVEDLSACFSWASNSHQTVIALEIRQLQHDLEEDAGPLPADIEKVDPACSNASSEAKAILEFVYQHASDDRIMPSDVIAYYHRANPLAKCATQLGRTKYGNADNQLLWALFGINNLMVLADSNAQEKLIHALPPPQPGSPIVIKVQSSYRQNPSQNHCTGTVLNLGSISSVDWNCN